MVIRQRARRCPVRRGHLGYVQPVGGVIAYGEHISVSGVGFDIACGNMAVKLDVPKKAIEGRIEPILQDIAANVSFGLGRTNKEKADHEVSCGTVVPGPLPRGKIVAD